MKKSTKRILSLFLVLMMVVSLFPTAYAAETGEVIEDEGYGSSWEDWDDQPAEEVAPVEEEPTDPFVEEPVEEPAPVEEPVEEPAPVEEPVDEPAPVEEPVVEEEPELSYPANTFYYVGGSGLRVTVDAPEGAFPADTEMNVSELPAAYVQDVVAASGVEGEVLVAADISFANAEGALQPNGKVKVSITSAEAARVSNVKIVHIGDDNSVEEVDQLPGFDANLMSTSAVAMQSVADERTLTFEADSFSVYAIIGEVVIEDEEGSFDFETENFVVTVSYTKEAAIPFGTRLVVSEIPADSDKYKELWDNTILELNGYDLSLDELHPDSRIGLASAVFFDVSLITVDGGEFEPAIPLQVNIHCKNDGLPLFDGRESGVIHFGDKGTELIRDVSVGSSGLSTYNGMPDGVMVNDFTYSQDGFSVVGAFTTDKFVEEIQEVNTSFAPLAAVRGEGDKIASSKSVTDEDGDGIYDLKLSVTGNSNKSESEKLFKSNVVLVIDVSGSMDTSVNRTTYVYSKDTYDPNGSYRGSNNGYNNWHNPVYYDTDQGRWYYTNYGSRQYLNANATIQTNFGNRLDATKSAARTLVRNLLANNSEAHPDIVEISIVKFANKTATSSYNGTVVLDPKKSTNADALITTINGLSEGGGTHWEAALATAKEEIDSFPISTDENVEETNYVIFLTDGFPTMYGDDTGGSESDANVSRAFYESLNEARAIPNDITTFFTIFAYGNNTTHGQTRGNYNTGSHTGYQFLCGLTNYAYGTGTGLSAVSYAENTDHCFNASDTSALQEAFAKISDKISSNVGFGGVAISDGLSVGSTNSTIAVDGTVHPEYFVYTVYDENKTVLYTVTYDASGNATFKNRFDETLTPVTKKSVTTVLPDPTDTDPDHTKSVTTEVSSVPYGTGAGATTYMMAPATVATDGMINWDLSGLGILEKWTYELSFKVWPNQAGYDIAADLNNGLYNGDLETAIADYLTNGKITQDEAKRLKETMKKDPATGLYVVSTNYTQSISYHEASITQEEGQDPETTYGAPQNDNIVPIPNPIPLTGSLIPMEKRWGADLAIVELQELVFGKNNTYTGYKVTLNLARDGADYMSYTFPKLNAEGKPVDKDGNVSTDVEQLVWQQDAAIAPGRLVSEDPGGGTHKTVTLSGTNKDGEDISGTYYIINDGHEYKISEAEGSDLHFEFATDDYHPMIVDGQLMNIKFAIVGTNGEIADGSDCEVIDPEMTSVFATNTLKGGLNIRKVVTKEDKTTAVADCKDEFTFHITLKDKNGNAFFTPTDQYTLKPDGSLDTYTSGFAAWNIYDCDGERVDRNAIPASGELTLTMPADGEIRVVNLPTGVTYTVEEVIDPQSGEYHYLKTVSAVKIGEDDSGADIFDPDVEPTTVTTNEVSGAIVGNKAKLETFWNWAASFYVYHSSDNTIEKISFSDPRVKGTYTDGVYTYEYNIVEDVKDGFLYGGYYGDYGGKSEGLTAAKVAGLTYTDGVVTDAAGCKAYDAASFYAVKGSTLATSVKFWVRGNAAKTLRADESLAAAGKGTELAPKAGDVYFLKEVPEAFLHNRIQYIYDWSKDFEIEQLFSMTAVDDALYTTVGFDMVVIVEDVNGDTKVAKLCGSYTFNQHNDPKQTEVIKATSFAGVPNGYVGVYDDGAVKFIPIDTSTQFVVTPCWTTLDGVKVLGTPQGYKFNTTQKGGLVQADVTIPDTETTEP